MTRMPLLLVAVLASLAIAATAHAKQPNVVLVMTDDQTVDDMRFLPKTRALIGRAGTTYEESFASFPLCCPSRAAHLSGQYGHNNGVLGNSAPDGGYSKLDFTKALAARLQQRGYYTAHFGKLMNGYGSERAPDIPPGYDFWFGAIEPTTYRMYDWSVFDNGVVRRFGSSPADYQTDALTERASQLIAGRARSRRPFFVQLSLLAPHWEFSDTEGGPRPAPRHEGAYADLQPRNDPSYDERDVSDKPAAIRNLPPLTDAQKEKILSRQRQRAASLLAVDDAVERIVGTLRASGELDDTVVIFTADNGYFHGEHRVRGGKILAYEPAIRVPLLIRGPGFRKGARASEPVVNVDVAPTILDLAGGPQPELDGVSLLDPWHGRDRAILLQGRNRPNTVEPGVPAADYVAVRTRRFKFIRHTSGETELYDLARDPYELTSRHDDRRYARVKNELARALERLRTCRGRSCHVRFTSRPT